MVSLLFLPSTTPLKTKQPSRKEICCQGKKSKELVGNWNQRFLDAKAIISIVNFGKGSN